MKEDRNCGYQMFSNNGMMPMPMGIQMPMPMGVPTTYNTYNYDNVDLNTLNNKINSLEQRVSSLENMVNSSYNNYNTNNYQMM